MPDGRPTGVQQVSILLLEDTTSDAALIRASLKPPDDVVFNVVHHVRLQDAIASLDCHDFDAALIDLNLPDALGLETVRALRDVTQLPLIVLSSVTDEETKRLARREGVTEFVTKWGLDGAAIARTLIYAAEQNRKQKLLLEVAKAHVDPTWLVDEFGTIVFANEAAIALSESPGAPVAAVGLHTDFDLDRDMTTEHRRLVDGQERVFDVKVSHLERTSRPMVLIAVRDVTEKERARELERRLYHADRLASIGRLASGVAHEVNNPATFILSNQLESLRLLDELVNSLSNSEDRRAREYAESCKRLLTENRMGAERIAAVAEQLRSFARVEGQTVEELLLKDVIDVARKLTLNDTLHRAAFSLNSNQERPLVADRGKLTQMFTNLLVNALDAIEPGHQDRNAIGVDIDADDVAVTVRIRDTGTGIAPDDLARIFEPFFTTKPFGKGTGLGLALCAEIVQFHQGTITCSSELGQGTEFVVALPYGNGLSAPPRGADPAIAQNQDRRPRLLFVDDDEFVRRALTRELKKRYDVVASSSAEEALGILKGDADFDVIICDLMMPNIDGPTMWRMTKEHSKQLGERFVFLTGGGALEHSDEHPREVPTLKKPVNWVELDKHVRRLSI